MEYCPKSQCHMRILYTACTWRATFAHLEAMHSLTAAPCPIISGYGSKVKDRITCRSIGSGSPRPRLLKPGVHTNDFAPIHRLRALKLGHASLATVFRPGRLTLQPILRENLESPVLRYQPITTAVVTDACLNTRWHHGAYTSAVLRESLGLDRVVTVYAELSRPDWLATVQSGRKQVQSRVCTPSFMNATNCHCSAKYEACKEANGICRRLKLT